MADTIEPVAAAESQAPAAEPVAAPAAEAAEPQYTNRDEFGRFVSQVADREMTESTMEQLAGKGGDITVADLRRLPGADKYTDAQLQQMWDSTNQQPAAATPPAGATAAEKRAWKALQGDVEVADLSKLSAADLLKLSFEYQANGKPQRRTFDEIVRNAQQGHYNAERMTQLQTERQTALDNWRRFEQQTNELTAQRTMWEQALNAAHRGDFKPLQAVLDAYGQALSAQPAAQPGQVPAGYVPAAQVEAERAGQHVFNTVVLPKAAELASRYGLQPQEVADAIMLMVEREPAEFMTQARFQQIVDVELPAHIEGFVQGRQPAADPRDATIAQLQADLAAARGTTATAANARVEQLHNVRRNAPPASTNAPAASTAMESPDFASGADAKSWLRNLK